MTHSVTASGSLTIDVTHALPADLGDALAVAASVHLPPGGAAPHAALVCWPGGSYARAYWDMQIPGHPGYSFAEYMSARGFLLVACDHLGVGASSRPADGDRVGFATMSAAAAAFVDRLRALLAEGDPSVGGRPLPGLPVIGIGHSLGGCLTVVTQAEHRSYDAIASLGFTHGQKDVAVTAAGAEERDRDANEHARLQAAVDQARAFFGDAWDDVYGLVPRGPHHGWLHRPNVPAAVIAADDAEAVAWPRQSYVEALLAGHSAAFAARVSCPVFLGFGDHDVPPTPHDDVAFYPGSRDVTLHVLADTAHCHNFSPARTQQWERIAAWALALASAYGTRS